ncbi:cell division protein FtsL [Clostridium algifaecis]|nr:cell division protein FtsL [Clostridium algifaecis]
MNEDKIVNGNNAIQPEYTEEKRIVKRKRTNKNKVRNKLRVIRNIGIIFIIGIILISRYSAIYNMQMELNSTQNRIENLNTENGNLMVELVKYNNLQYIEDNAINKLHMIQPSKASVVYVDLNKSIVKQETSDKNNKKFNTVLNKLKQFKWR